MAACSVARKRSTVAGASPVQRFPLNLAQPVRTSLIRHVAEHVAELAQPPHVHAVQPARSLQVLVHGLGTGQSPRPPGSTVKDFVSDFGFEPVDVAERSFAFTAARRVFLDFADLPADADCSARMVDFAASPDAEHPCILHRSSLYSASVAKCCPAIALEQLQTVALETAPHAALAVPPLVVQAVGKLAERDEAQVVHCASSFANMRSPSAAPRSMSSAR